MFHYPTPSGLCIVAPGKLLYASGLTHSSGNGEAVYTRSVYEAAVFTGAEFAERMAAILAERAGQPHEVKRRRDLFLNRESPDRRS